MNIPRPKKRIYLFALMLLLALTTLWQTVSAQSRATVDCVNGEAVTIGLGAFPCLNVGFESAIPTNVIGLAPSSGADIWGWTDDMDTPDNPDDDREYAIIANAAHTAFVDVTDPAMPVYLATLAVPGGLENALWRDVKTLHHYALIVGDFNVINTHGLQIFDLKKLRPLQNALVKPVLLSAAESTQYFGTEDEPLDTIHNIVTNEEKNMAYAVAAAPSCGGGIHAINMTNPLAPEFAGCFDNEISNVHDSLCTVYRGPDTDHTNKTICFNSSEDLYEIVDMTKPAEPVVLSTIIPPSLEYAHQGWLTEDQAYFVTGDELDELNGSVANTTTYIFDVRDLDDIQLLNEWSHQTLSTDHNLYIKDGLAYLANYTAGLRILDLSNVSVGELKEVGYFDSSPVRDEPATSGGLWSVYPYFDSGTVVVNDLVKGLIVLRPELPNFSISQSVTVSSERAIPQPGEMVVYSTTLTNTGTIEATDVVVTMNVNGKNYPMTGSDTIAVDGVATYTLDYTVLATDCDFLSAKATAKTVKNFTRRVDLPLRTPVCDGVTVPLAVGMNSMETATTMPVVLLAVTLLGVTGVIFGRKRAR